jgi:hypothetical protein
MRFDLCTEDGARGVKCHQGGALVERHQARETSRVGSEDRGELVLDGSVSHSRRLDSTAGAAEPCTSRTPQPGSGIAILVMASAPRLLRAE